MDKQKWLEIVKIICTAIISITATLLAQSCNTVLSVNKAGANQNVNTEQRNQVDSTDVRPSIGFPIPE